MMVMIILFKTWKLPQVTLILPVSYTHLIYDKKIWIRCYGILKWNEDKTKPLFFSGRVTHQDEFFVIDPVTNFPREHTAYIRLKEYAQNEEKQLLIGFTLSLIHIFGKSVWNYHSYDIVIFLLLLIVTVGLYVVMIYTINYMNKCAENNQVKMHSQFLLDQIKNYERSEEKNSQFRHDVRHHMMHLANLIDEKNPKAALDYIEEYDKAVLSLSQKRYCTNAVINNIISSYATRFQEKNIAFSVKCPIKDDLKMKDIDLSLIHILNRILFIKNCAYIQIITCLNK